MSQEPSVNQGSTFLTFLAGAALGGVVVALTTPKRGSDLRKDISRLSGKAKDQIDDWVDSASGAVEGIKTSWKENGETAIREVKAKAGDVVAKSEDAWKDVKSGASSAGSDFKSGLSVANRDLHT